jgi:hypothetical protein
MRKKTGSFPNSLLILAVAYFTAALPLLITAGQVVPKTKPLKVKHVITPVITYPGNGKVEVNLTTKEIVFTKTKDGGFLRIKLFRDFKDVAGKDYIYSGSHRVPLTGGLYFVSLSAGGDTMIAALFQVTSDGRVQIIPLG